MLDEAAKRSAKNVAARPQWLSDRLNSWLTKELSWFSIVYQSIPCLRKTIFDFSLKVGNLKVRTCSWRMWNSWIAVLVFCSMRILFVTFWPVSVGFTTLHQVCFGRRHHFQNASNMKAMHSLCNKCYEHIESNELRKPSKAKHAGGVKKGSRSYMKLWWNCDTEVGSLLFPPPNSMDH